MLQTRLDGLKLKSPSFTTVPNFGSDAAPDAAAPAEEDCAWAEEGVFFLDPALAAMTTMMATAIITVDFRKYHGREVLVGALSRSMVSLMFSPKITKQHYPSISNPD